MKNYIKLGSLFFTALIFTISSLSSFAANAVIDVLVVYTKGTADLYGGDPTTRFNQVFQVTNQIYKDSNVNAEIRVAKTMMVDYTDDNASDIALNDITYAKNPAFSGVAAAREQAKADMVIFYRPFKQVQGSCGIAWIGGQDSKGDFSNPGIKNYMYAHIAINSCGDYVTAHELGHNMGLKHSRKQDGSGGTFPYALGYGIVNQFTTIMAYQSEFSVDYWTGKQYKFSNPELICKGVPCGVDRNDPVNGSDAHYVLNITAPQIANYYAAPVVSSSSSVASSKAASSVAPSSKPASSAAVSSKPASSLAKSSVVSSKVVSSVASSKINVVVASSSKAASSLPKSSEKSAAASSAKPVPVISSSAASVAKSSKAASSVASSKAAVVNFTKVADVAQYGGVAWTNEVRREKALTIDQAKAIAAANPNITYFFIVKSAQVSLGTKGTFRLGDAVFFSGKPWYGSAVGMADAFEKAK